LIETIAAIFILITTLVAGLGLTLYAFSNAANSQSEIVASNLAREGVEVVRAMRDSNWLAGDKKGNPPWDLGPCSDIGNKLCYPRAYQKVDPYNGYNLNNIGNQIAIFDLATSTWSLDSTGTLNVNLYLQANGTYSNVTNGISVYGRMINITLNSNPPYTNQNSNQELIIKSVVAWRGKNCTAFNSNQDLLTLSTSCKVVVEEHLTNWKDYK
jgi:Tfp pilus assembly protein PilV